MTQGPFSIAYEAIKARIYSQCPDISFVSLWNQQVRDLHNQKTWDFSFPAAFIEFVKPTRVQTLGNGWRIWEPLLVKVHIISTFYNATNGVDSFEENPGAMDLQEELYLGLIDYEAPGCVALFCVAEEYDYDHTDVYHTTSTFQTNLVDGGNNRPRGGTQWVPGTLDLIINPWDEGILLQEDEGPYLTEQGGYFLWQ